MDPNSHNLPKDRHEGKKSRNHRPIDMKTRAESMIDMILDADTYAAMPDIDSHNSLTTT